MVIIPVEIKAGLLHTDINIALDLLSCQQRVLA